MPFLELFDAADACDAYRRTTSVVPQQALALVNSELDLRSGPRAGGQLWRIIESGGDEADRETTFVRGGLRAGPRPCPRRTRSDEPRLAFLARQIRLFQQQKPRSSRRARQPDADPQRTRRCEAARTSSTPCSATTTS